MKFRIISGIVLLVVLFGCYVVAKNTNTEQGDNSSAEHNSAGEYSNFK